MRSTSWTACLFIAALLQFCLFLNHRDITSAHEGRTAETAREMIQRGDWIVPYCNGVPRLAKPPLMYWATALAWTVTGAVEPWSARLPAALCGALAVLLVMDLARRTLGRDAALCAGLIWISTWFIVDEYRKAMADPYLAFFTLLSIWAWIRADTDATPTPGQSAGIPRSGKCPPRAVAFTLLAYAAAALGALTKAHLIVLHLIIALGSYHLVRRSRPRLPWAHAVGAIVFLAIAAAWPMYIFFNTPNAWAIWRGQMLATDATSGEKFSPIWDYLAALPMTTAPWTVFALIGALMPLLSKRRRERRAMWPLIWLAGTVAVFTIVPMKKATYLLPAMPAQTLLAAAAMSTVLRWPRRARDAANERFLMAAHLIAAVIAVGVCVYLLLDLDRFAIEPPTPMVIGAALAGVALIGIAWLRPNFRSVAVVISVGILFALCVQIAEAWLIPQSMNQGSDAPFARRIRDRVGDDGPLQLIGPGLREDVLFYLGGRSVPRIHSIEELQADYRGFAIVTADRYAAVSESARGDELAKSADRNPKDRLYFFSFPKSAEPPRNAR